MFWQKIAERIDDLDFGANHIAVATVNDKQICIARYNGSVFAFAYKCPHAGALLAEGYINALGAVVCPLHRYRYDIRTGINVSGEGFFLRRWPLEVRDDGVYVLLED